MRFTRARVLTVSIILSLGILSVGPAWAQDPGTSGPFAVTREEYNFGDTAFTPPSFFPGPIEVRASVHYPTGLPSGPFPLVVFLHGRHSTCFQGGTAFGGWPCAAGRSPIPSFMGYDYISSVLASHGYIVVSISANGINAADGSSADAGMQARAELIHHHLNIWSTFNSVGGAPFGTKFIGKVDLDNVGTMGHSRGGGGVVQHFVHNQSLGSPFGIKAVFPLAPVNFNRVFVTNIPVGVLLPYCDGDVADLQGIHYYDDARYAAAGDPSPKHSVLVMGGNHNFYNTVWTPGFGFPASDDWGIRDPSFSDPFCGNVPGNGRLTPAETRGTGLAYIAGFFRLYLGGDTEFAPIFSGDAPPPPSAMTSDIHMSYHAPDTPSLRRDVNRLLDASHLTTNHLGGSVTRSGFTPYDLCGGEFPQPQHCLVGQPNSRQPHTTPSAFTGVRGLSQLRGGWISSTATYTNNIPAGSRDVSAFKVFQFRAAVDFTDTRNIAGVDPDFRVRLTDGAGATADVLISSHSQGLFYPPGGPIVTPLPKVILNTIRIPLTAFGGVNLSDVRSVQFRFNQTASGGLLLTDLAFADTGAPAAPPDLVVTAVTNPPATISAGASFSVTDTTRNQGAGAAGESSTRFYFSLDSTRSAGDILLGGTDAVPALAATTQATDTTSVTVPAGTAPGTYFLLACADDLAVIGESAEGNNCRASTTTVEVLAPGDADLVVTAVSNPPASRLIGGTFSVTDTVENQGSSSAVSSLNRYYLSLNLTKGPDDTLLTGTRKIPVLAASASSTGTKTLTIKLATPPGTYFLLACADDKNVVPEGGTAETNNCRASATTIVVTAPDLVVTAVSDPPASRPAGGSFPVTDTTRNAGSAPAADTTTRFYLSLNKLKNAFDVLLTGTRTVGPLGVGGVSSGPTTVTVPGGTPAGTYFLLACADDLKVVTEGTAGEKNNCRASATKIAITP